MCASWFAFVWNVRDINAEQAPTVRLLGRIEQVQYFEQR